MSEREPRPAARDWRVRLREPDEKAARELAFNGGNYPQGEPYRLLRLALAEIDCLREEIAARGETYPNLAYMERKGRA